ncbi:MAG: beta-ketoacyl synthase N-terminal-like domain-containing protein, partial [Gemmatimonadota bacterium]|nr:beta-ketoacyl synthase N-terminal-like domain-containing protein [Gemmatimonadota bacterium]
MTSRRVVVTGLGLVTAVGLDTDETWSALLDGRSGAAPITLFDPSGQDVRFACEVSDWDPEPYLDAKEVRRTDRFVQFALGTAQQAMEQAGGEEAVRRLDPNRTGVIVGSGIGGLATLEEQHIRMLERGPGRVSPFFIPMFIADMAAGMISMRYGARGPNYATVSACSSSAHAVGL